MKMSLKSKTKDLKLGFTLVELLVVMTILGILTVITLGNFRTSQIKARDAQRKSDLRQIANALEAYFNDHSGYPSGASGRILACTCEQGDRPCDWTQDPGEREFCDENNTVYMNKVPGDPVNDPPYYYRSNGTYYQLYANLENNNDPEASLSIPLGEENYNFGVASPNCSPENETPEDPDEGCL
jgi:prepilin-type N-terminal cleavage/methylation domain-containing protein